MPETHSPSVAGTTAVPARPPHLALGVATLVTGLVASIGAFWAARHAEHGKVQIEFEHRAQGAVHLVHDELQRHRDTLYTLRNLFHFSDVVTRAEFAGAAHELIARQTGVGALEWARRVPAAERTAIEAAVRAEGFPAFEFRERGTGNEMKPSPPRPEYFPVLFVEPVAANFPVLGFDLQSGVTWPVFERAAGTGEFAASGRLPLLTAGPAPEWGYIMELPVYSTPDLPATPEERRARLRGYVLGIFEIARTLESSFTDVPEGEDILEVLFLDRSAAPESQFLHYHSRGVPATDGAHAPATADFTTGMHVRMPVDYAGRNWELWIRPRADWLATRSHLHSWLTLALGLVMTGAAGSYMFGAVRREAVVRQMVDERTAELRATQAALERDIRERRETERQLGNVISQLPGAAFRCAFDEKLTASFASDGMFQLTGYAAEDFVSGRINIADLTVPEDRAATRAKVAVALKDRTAFELEYRLRDREGRERHVLARGRPVYADDGALRFIEGLAIDVTALKTAEATKIAFERKMLETQKLESLGVLAGGIAHDFNNLITAMMGNASLARYSLPAGNASGEHLHQIEIAARRAAELCQQLLAYAGKQELSPRPTDMSELVRSTATLLRVSMHKNTRLELHLDDQLPSVFADPAQIQQIVMNLVINAAEAIGDKPGEITVSTFQRQADASFLRTALHGPELPTGTYVVLEVRDNGSGMAPETLARIFEPFFTTKFSGRGLGLAAVLGIVQRHRGALFVESEPGRGSVFRLLLEAHGGEARRPATPVVAAGARLRGTAMVVDDEDAVREVLGAVLRRHGMTPILAASGDEALRLYATHHYQVDLVMLDLTMPGLSGEETLRALRDLNPTQRVLVMSGYSERDTMDRCRALGVAGFISKPFELPVLLEKLESVVA